jgi:hypothetical protein
MESKINSYYEANNPEALKTTDKIGYYKQFEFN